MSKHTVYRCSYCKEGDVAAMRCGTLPVRERTRPRIEKLTDAERNAMGLWAEKWERIGLSTDPADRPLFEAAVAQCYLAAGLNVPRVVWCPSPLAAVLAGSQYALTKDSAVDDAVGNVVRCAVDGTVRGAVDSTVRDVVRNAVGGALGNVVHNAVGGAVGNVVRNAVRNAVGDAVGDLWWRFIGGQFWAGWWWHGSPASASFFLDVLRLQMNPRLELAARAYHATVASACWWWPHRDCVFVSERPHTLEVRPGKKPLVLWDGWGIGE